MNEQLRDQISAFVDSELPEAEGELLVRRLGREAAMRELAGRYLIIGQALRGETSGGAPVSLRERIMAAIEADGERGEAPPETAAPAAAVAGGARWMRPMAGLGTAAAIALAAVFALQFTGPTDVTGGSAEQLSYTVVPVSGAEAQAPMHAPPPIRLTNYLMSHGEYAGSLGRKSIQSGIVGTSAAQAMSGYVEMEIPEREQQ